MRNRGRGRGRERKRVRNRERKEKREVRNLGPIHSIICIINSINYHSKERDEILPLLTDCVTRNDSSSVTHFEIVSSSSSTLI